MKRFLFLVFVFLIFPYFVFASDKVEINTASLEQLDKITGIGPALAQRIIDARPFSSVDDLLRVKGIGEKTLQKIKDQGLAYVENPNAQNPQAPSPEEKATTVPTSPAPSIVYPAGIFINEIMPNPEGSDSENEWIEIFNQNDFSVDLSGWKIKDKEGNATSFIFKKDTSLLARKYLVLKRPETKITLNNDNDRLELINPKGEIIDSVSYQKAPNSQSYNKIGQEWQWSANLTPGSINIVVSGENKETNQNNSLKEIELSKTTAQAKEKLPDFIPSNRNGSASIYIIAVLVSIICASLILFLKILLVIE